MVGHRSLAKVPPTVEVFLTHLKPVTLQRQLPTSVHDPMRLFHRHMRKHQQRFLFDDDSYGSDDESENDDESDEDSSRERNAFN